MGAGPPDRRATVRAFAPGRVNVIGDHTDYVEGHVLPMAVQFGTTVSVRRGGDRVELRSDSESEPAVVGLDVSDPAAVEPAWARYVAGVVAELRPDVGAKGTIASDLPKGAGLSSSAALEVAVALALGARGTAADVAALCQRAEARATGVPCGIMDQLTSMAARLGALLHIDCRSLVATPVPWPDGVVAIGVHSGQARALAGSAYGDRRRECGEAERYIGPLRDADLTDLAQLGEARLRRRARHVITENQRVRDFIELLSSGDYAGCGSLMLDSHASLRDDYEVSTPVLDELVSTLADLPGVYGARLTGGGFGGVVVALADAAADVPLPHWRFVPSSGARLLDA